MQHAHGMECPGAAVADEPAPRGPPTCGCLLEGGVSQQGAQLLARLLRLAA